MDVISLYKVFLLFIIYSFVGWVSEVIYCSVPAKHFINRGFLYGPICPVYGFGGLIVIFLLQPFSDSIIWLFFSSMLFTSILEYITSWILEKLFDTKWWDYSSKPFNIHGRVCLLNSVLFGILGVFVVKLVHPTVLALLNKVNDLWITISFYTLFTILVADLAVTIHHLVDFRKSLAKIEVFFENLKLKFEQEKLSYNGSSTIEDFIYKVKQDSKKFNADILDKFEQIKKKNRQHRRFIKKFPGIKSSKFVMALKHMREEDKEKK